MKNKLIKALVVGMLVASSATVNAAILTGTVDFSVNFSVAAPPGAGLSSATVLAPNYTGPTFSGLTGTGNYTSADVTGAPISFPGNIIPPDPLQPNYLNVLGNQNFTVWSFYGLSTGYLYRLVSSDFSVSRSNPGGGFEQIWITGHGVAYLRNAADTMDILDPSLATWTIVGTQTDQGISFAMTTSASGRTPDGGTTLVLLGLALSGLGLIRNKLS